MRLSHFGEVQKVRFLSIFSKAPNESIFFRNVHKNSKEGPHHIKFTLLIYFYMFYKKIWFFIAVSKGFELVKVILRTKKKHKSDPYLGSFLAIIE